LIIILSPPRSAPSPTLVRHRDPAGDGPVSFPAERLQHDRQELATFDSAYHHESLSRPAACSACPQQRPELPATQCLYIPGRDAALFQVRHVGVVPLQLPDAHIV